MVMEQAHLGTTLQAALEADQRRWLSGRIRTCAPGTPGRQASPLRR